LPHARLLDAFGASLASDVPPDLATAHDGLRNQEIMEAIYASARTHQAVPLSLKTVEH
jgi:predicted dehydrogenase